MRAALLLQAIGISLLLARPVLAADDADRAEAAATRAEAAAQRAEDAARRVEAAADRLERIVDRYVATQEAKEKKKR